MYTDDELVMISALQHDLFCRRQCALIHVEGAWSENRLTAEGRVLHEHVDVRGSETRRTIRQVTALRLVSHKLGLVGIADMVEFHLADSAIDAQGDVVAAPLNGTAGLWRPFPVEYKRGKPKSHRADEVQLCAQAICLEEMLKLVVPRGALFYGEPRRRMEVAFDDELRALTQRTADDVHELISGGVTPVPEYDNRCESCSLVDECRPRFCRSGKSAKKWIAREIAEVVP